MATRIARADYAALYGPTTGDRTRLGDTDLIIEVARDLTTYGEAVRFGGGKVIPNGMGQSQISQTERAVDTVITNALIVDHSAIYKAVADLRANFPDLDLIESGGDFQPQIGGPVDLCD